MGMISINISVAGLTLKKSWILQPKKTEMTKNKKEKGDDLKKMKNEDDLK